MTGDIITNPLSADEAARYSRHVLIPGVGLTGQNKLKMARVLVVGAGGLGSPVLQYLAAAGVGRIGILDGDSVSLSNLQRQTVHGTENIGKKKVASAAEALLRLNPHVSVIRHDEWLNAENALRLFEDYDVVIDGSDNFETRFLISDACVALGIPSIWGSVFQFSGQVSVFDNAYGPCYRCLYPEAPPLELAPSCSEGGVFGAVCGIVGSVMCAEAMKLILGVGKGLSGRVLTYNALTAETEVNLFDKRADCEGCGASRTAGFVGGAGAYCKVAPGGRANATDALDGFALSRRLMDRELGLEDFELWDVRETSEWNEGHIEGAVNVPLTVIREREATADGLPSKVVLYCLTGKRSLQAEKLLRALGVEGSSLVGGINSWHRLGLPLVNAGSDQG
ncbi:molybdopterin biosynthesis protein MoeZ [Rathayibacter tritici]|uniref:Molybdopterin biosynthesis protein MoeZ n=2 Tax=Rathayibacter tritici TaxID=33888 RepID=A0A160KUD3_9MICO|nr:molybdopterin biosynthesis protein MoeZ [Rathayibacter tritici]